MLRRIRRRAHNSPAICVKHSGTTQRAVEVLNVGCPGAIEPDLCSRPPIFREVDDPSDPIFPYRRRSGSGWSGLSGVMLDNSSANCEATRAEGAERGERRLPILVGYTVILAAFVLLIFQSNVPPIADYPNHLARAFIQSHAGLDPVLARFYEPFWHFQPNLAFDAAMWLMAPFVDVYGGGRLFLLLLALATLGGLAALHFAVHRRVSVFPMLGALLVVNRFLRWGSVSYLFTLGVALLALACWIMLRRRRGLQLLAGTAFSVAIYLGHLYAFGVYAVCILGWELFDRWPRRGDLLRELIALCISGLQFVPAAVLFLLVSPAAEAGGIVSWNFVDKLKAPIVLLPGYNLALELALLGVVGAIVAFGFATRRIRLRPDLALCFAGLVLLFFLMPSTLLTGYGVDRRIVVPIAFIAVASLDWGEAKPAWKAGAGLCAGIVTALFLAHVALTWRSTGEAYDEVIGLAANVERGASVDSIVLIRGDEYLSSPPLHEAAALFVIERSAFVPSLFAHPAESSQALKYAASEVERVGRRQIQRQGSFAPVERTALVGRLAAGMVQRRFDYLLLVDLAAPREGLPDWLELVARSPNGAVSLWRLPGQVPPIR